MNRTGGQDSPPGWIICNKLQRKRKVNVAGWDHNVDGRVSRSSISLTEPGDSPEPIMIQGQCSWWEPVNMKTIWILAWCALSLLLGASQPTERTTFSEGRSLKKRQLDFGGGGGGVNRYVNGDQEYEDYDPEDDIEYWRMVSSFPLTLQLHFWLASDYLFDKKRK